jgi:phosphonate transport system substrate-binding protein
MNRTTMNAPRHIEALCRFVLSTAALCLASSAFAQTDCPNRGELEAMYCDANNDMVADAPTDPKRYNNPRMLVFTYTPVEGAIVYEKIFAPFMQYLAGCTGKKAVYYAVESHAAEMEAMRDGRLHVAGFSTGTTMFAVNTAGAIPFAVKGDAKGFQGYQLLLVVRKDSPFQRVSDLKGKRVAHTSPSSNSGHLAPLALFPGLGLTPEKDYTILFSGKHDQSILGVKSGTYDAAAVASDVLHRLVAFGQVREDDFRVLYRSSTYPTSAFTYAHNLEPEFRDRMLQCFYDFRFPPEMQKAFDGADRFVPASYKKDWDIVRRTQLAGTKVKTGVWVSRKETAAGAP